MRGQIKWLSLLLTAILSISVLSGCGAKNTAEQAGIDLSKEDVITENNLPISKESITLTIWTSNGSQGYVKSYNDFQAFKEIAKKTGVNFEFVHPTGTAREQLSIMLASGDCTDIIAYWLGSSRVKELAKEGTIYTLTDYIEKWAPNFRKVLEDRPSLAKELKNRSKDIYGFPRLTDDKKYSAYDGYLIRKDWLDKLGLGIPKTIDEWETILKAFRDTDLNGNGKQDEVPFSSTVAGLMYRDAFTSGFGTPAYGYHLDQSTKKITHSIFEPEFKEFMTTIIRWYGEGLLNPNYVTATVDELDSLMLNNKLGAVYIDNNNSLPKYMLNNPDMDLSAVPFPVDKNGISYHPKQNIAKNTDGFEAVITSSCKHVKEAVRALDYLYSKEASDLMFWGVKGKSYTIDSNGDYHFTDEILKNPEGKVPYEAICKYMTNTGFIGVTQYKAMVGLEVNLTNKVKKIKENSVNYSLATNKDLYCEYPTTVEEDKELGRIGGDLNTYLDEMYTKFMLGIEPMSNYDAFVEKTKELGIENAIKIMQTAYDRVN